MSAKLEWLSIVCIVLKVSIVLSSGMSTIQSLLKS